MKLLSEIFIIYALIIASPVGQVYASPKVTQSAFVDFKINSVIVFAIEEFNKSPMLVFLRQGKDGQKIIQSIKFSEVESTGEFAYVNSFLRFKTFRIKDIASPLIIALAVQPSGSDEWAEVKLIAEKNSKITDLNPGKIIVTIQDGFYLGFINKKYGSGMITWNFQWDAAHYEPHKYEIKIFQWDSNNMEFILKNKFITKKRFATYSDALKFYGLPSKNFRDEIINIGEDISTLGIESILEESKPVEK